MKRGEEEKLKGLLVIKSDRFFDERHPLWETVQAYRQLLEETHVLVFTKAKVLKRQMLVQPEPDIILYHCSTRFLLLRFWRMWKLLAFQLYWRKSFRTDFVLSFTARKGGLFAYALAKRFKRPYFLVASLRSALGAPLSLRRKIGRFLLRHAATVFVPGSQNALSLSKLLGIAPATLVTLQPAIDMASIAHAKEKHNFHEEHLQYNFFISSFAPTVDTLRELMMIYGRVAAKYPRAALIVLAPKDECATLTRFVRRTHSYGVFVYSQDDSYLSMIAGTQVYLGVNRTDEMDMMLISAFGLGIPAIAYRWGVAQEVLAGTPYERFAPAPGDAQGAAQLLIELIEHQPMRDEYAVNADVVYKRFPSRDMGTYVRTMFEVIELIVRPPKEGTSAGVMYLHNLQVEEQERLKNDGNAII